MNDLLKEVTELLKINKLSSLMEGEELRAASLGDPEELSKLRGAGGRDRVLRLPRIFASEMSVGQSIAEDSEERSIFELWMSGIDGKTPDEKIKEIQKFFNSDSLSENYTISQTLSHLQFVNCFVYIMKEFNPSVSGFLWEPLLAGLFGGKVQIGRQVPAGKAHDIADIRILTSGTDKPYSLKVLSGGDVKGSFKDLANHFKNAPNEEMIYEIIRKSTNDEMEFYRFTLDKNTIMEYLGGYPFRKVAVTKEIEFIMDPEQSEYVKIEDGILKIRHSDKNAVAKDLVIAHAPRSSKPAEEQATTIIKFTYTQAIERKHHDEMSLEPAGEAEKEAWNNKEIIFAGKYKAELAEYDGDTAVTQYRQEQDPKLRTGKAAKVWGNGKTFEKWSNLYGQTAGRPDLWADFWVQATDPDTGAPGFREKHQFLIPENQWAAKRYATLTITHEKVQVLFEKAAERIGYELKNMFNHLADLTDNIGRFFLSNCGGSGETAKCSKSDASNRGTAGEKAKQNASDLHKTTQASVEKLTAGDRQMALPFEHKITLTDLDSLIESMVKGTRKNKS